MTKEHEKEEEIEGIKFVDYTDESQLDSVMKLVGQDLSEPYSIFTYRYFLHQFPDLCILAIPTTTDNENSTTPPEPVGCVVCKIDEEEEENDDIVTTADTTTISNEMDLNNNTNNIPLTTSQPTKKVIRNGYMAMLAVKTTYRKSGIGTALAKRAIGRMKHTYKCNSVSLETEVTNTKAMRLYEGRLGFVREELLVRYYLNWGDAYRLRLWF